MIWILVTVFVVALVLRYPIAFALGLACLVYLIGADIPLILMPMKMYSGIDVFVLLSIPGFIIAGNLMNQGGLTERIISFCNHLLGHIRGGLALVNIGASMLFAGISGTAISDTASMGSVMIPAMKKEGYDADFSCAITAASSTVGPIIPPMRGFVDTFWSLLMTFIILFGIIGGIFTPTEASIVAVLYALVVGRFVYGKLNFKNVQVVILDSMKTSASLMVLVGFANLFGYILITEHIPQTISSEILGFSSNKYVVLLLINLLLIAVGTFMETIAALLILFPILLKVALAVDVDPIHFAVIAVLNLIIGLTTPPVGVCLFVASSIGKVSIGKVSRAGLPFLLVSLVVLVMVTLIPEISLWLPSLFTD